MPGLELHCDSTGLVQNVPQHLTQISNLPMDPFNSSTSQISFLWNVISPREKVSVPINPFVWQYYINPFACILDWAQIVSTDFQLMIVFLRIISPIFILEINLQFFIRSFFSFFWMNIHTHKIILTCLYTNLKTSIATYLFSSSKWINNSYT